MEEKKFCKKVVYRDNRPTATVLLGLIISDTPDFLIIRTARKETTIARHAIISISDTDETFREAGR